MASPALTATVAIDDDDSSELTSLHTGDTPTDPFHGGAPEITALLAAGNDPDDPPPLVFFQPWQACLLLLLYYGQPASALFESNFGSPSSSWSDPLSASSLQGVQAV